MHAVPVVSPVVVLLVALPVADRGHEMGAVGQGGRGVKGLAVVGVPVLTRVVVDAAVAVMA